MTNINIETTAIEEKDRKHQEIEELKADIQEVLLIIQQLQKTTKKLQKQNRITSSKSIDSEAGNGNNLIKDRSEKEGIADEQNVAQCDVQVQSISFSSELSWNSLRNLTRGNYNNLANNDKQFAKLVKSLFFPNLKSVDNIFDNKINLTKWKKHITDLQIVIEKQKGYSFGEYLFKENLGFSQEIYNSYEQINLFGKDFNEDHKRNVTRDFFDEFGSEIMDNIKDRYGLTSEEARIFTIYLACMADFDKTVLGFDYGSMHEFFQNTWMKINSNQDQLRKKQIVAKENKKLIVHSDFSRFKSCVSSGFNSYFTLFNQYKFELWFVEQKCGNSYVICKNYKNIDIPLHKSIFNLANKRTNKKFQGTLQKAGFTHLQSIDFSGALFKRYTYYYDSLGNNFLIKTKVHKYAHDLIFGLERNGFPKAKELARKLIKAAKDNHRLIALIQNGYTLDDDDEVVNFLDLIDRRKQSIRIFGKIFTFKPMKNEKDELIVSIEGYSENLLKEMKKDNPKFNPEPYKKLNSVFQAVSQRRSCKIKELLSSDDYIETLLTSYNGLVHEIFNYLVDRENFVSFEKLKNGRTFVCGEIASEEISAVKKWFEKNQRLYSAIPYTIIYFWKLPFFGKLREISRSDNLKLNRSKELAYKRLFSHNDKEVFSFLEDLTTSDFSEEDLHERVEANPEYSFLFSFLSLLKGNTRLKLRKNLFEQGDTLRTLVFLDEKGIPLRIFGDDKKVSSKDNPYLNIKVDFNDIFSTNKLLDRNILSTFPIAIKLGKSAKRYQELKFRFCRTDGKRVGLKGIKARELYIERIRGNLGHIEEINDVIDVLYSKPAISFNLLRGENREIMMKLFIYLLFEYNEVWKEFSKSLVKYLEKKLPFTIEKMVLNDSFVKAGWNIIVKSIKESENKGWLIHYVVENKFIQVFERKIKVLPAFVNIRYKKSYDEKIRNVEEELTLFCNYNSLYLQVLSILESEIMSLILVKDEPELDSKTSHEWKNNINWMEKACV